MILPATEEGVAMKSWNIKMIWRAGFIFCSLIYVVWIVYLSQGNFDMVHSDYRRTVKRLQPAQIEQIALQELAAECRAELKYKENNLSAEKQSVQIVEDPCLSWPAATLAQKQEAVETRLVKERNRVRQKLVIFYITFGFFFMILPLSFLYFLLSFIFWIFKNVRIVE